MKRGISLIVLVITIIVIIILAGAVILSLSQNNPIVQATEAAFKSDLQEYKNELTLYLASEYSKKLGNLDTTTISASKTTGNYDGGKIIKQIITSMTDADTSNYIINKGKLVYIGSDINKKAWAKDIVIPDTYIKDNLILWLDGRDFQNTPSTTLWLDKSGNNNHASVYNFDYTTTSGSDGSGAVVFDGINDYINLGNLNFGALTNVTVSFWRKSNVSKYWLILSDISPNYWLMASHGSDSFYNNTAGGSVISYVDGVASLIPKDDNLWHYYTATNVNLSAWKTATLSNYVNFQYHSYLGDLKIYNRAFSASDVMNNFNAEKVIYGY
jgi:Tfp pilus assembly protein PilE